MNTELQPIEAVPVLGTISTSTVERLGRKNRCRVVWSACPDCGREKWVPLKWASHRCNPCHARLVFQPRGAIAKKPGAGAMQRRELNHRWNGGRKGHIGGYQLLHVAVDDPLRCMADSNGYAMEHRLVMARAIGRPLGRSEEVHHLNGRRKDNRLENLELWKRSHPQGVRQADYHCPGCQCFAHQEAPSE